MSGPSFNYSPSIGLLITRFVLQLFSRAGVCSWPTSHDVLYTGLSWLCPERSPHAYLGTAGLRCRLTIEQTHPSTILRSREREEKIGSKTCVALRCAVEPKIKKHNLSCAMDDFSELKTHRKIREESKSSRESSSIALAMLKMKIIRLTVYLISVVC